MATRVAVLGAGPLGLTAIKNLREEGFDVTGFEARSYVGGLWNPSTDSSLSVVESTVFNSSRFRSAFSDYPFDDDVDDYPTWQQMYKYMNGYCDHFGLRPHIQLNSKVTAMTREGNQWVIEVTPIEGPVRREHFDKVIVATGSFILPKSPKIPNIEHFQGRTLHAINFNTPSNYDGQRMLLIGLHATAQDVAKALHGHAEKLYITHRNGIILVRGLLRLLYALSNAEFSVDATIFRRRIRLRCNPNLAIRVLPHVHGHMVSICIRMAFQQNRALLVEEVLS